MKDDKNGYNKDYKTAFGKRLRKVRREQNITQESLAEKLGISQKHYSELERGLAGISVSTLIHVSDILNTSIDYLLKGSSVNVEDRYFSEIEEFYNDSSAYTKKKMAEMIRIAYDISNHTDMS